MAFYSSGILVHTGSIEAQSFTGSLQGTASWSENTLSASHAITASYAINGTFVTESVSSASYVSGSSAYVDELTVLGNSTLGDDPYADTLTVNALTDIFGETYIWNALEANGKTIINDLTGSFYGTASWAENVISASHAITSSHSITASYADLASTSTVSLEAKSNTVDVKAAMALTTGQVVHIFGSDGTNLLVVTASYESDLLSANTLGIVTASVANNGHASIKTFGDLGKLNTTAFSAGDLLYLGAAGSITNIKPIAPLHAVRLGYVEKVSAGNGEIFVKIDNGYELDELHDALISSPTSSGQLLIKSGALWINSNQLTGSYGLTGSLTATSFTGSLLGTASIALTAYNLSSSIYNREIHVSSGSGDDTLGNGSLLQPYKTVAKGLSVLGNTGEALIIHPGTYRENVSTDKLNINIQGIPRLGGIAVISGSLTVSSSGAANSVRIAGVAINDLYHTNSSSLYLNECIIYNSFNKSGPAAYNEVIDTIMQCPAGINITGAGTQVIDGNKQALITVGNANANVVLKNSLSCVNVAVNGGSFSAINSFIYSLTSGSAAITAGPMTSTQLLNCAILTPTATQYERISIDPTSGFLAYDDLLFNKASSTLGLSLNAKTYFQSADVITLTATGSLFGSASYSLSSSRAITSSHALTSSYINPLTQSINLSGSITLTGSIIINSGSITMPDRPAFRIIGTGGSVYATTVLSSSRITIDYNQGSAFNQSTGVFTAPIAGLYQVNLVIRTDSNTNNTINQAIVWKNNTTSSIMVEFGNNTSMNHAGGSTIMKLNAGDTLKAAVVVGTCSFDTNDNFSVAYIG